MKILLQELFFAKQVNYKDAFFFNVKQTKYKMITFRMITSVFTQSGPNYFQIFIDVN